MKYFSYIAIFIFFTAVSCEKNKQYSNPYLEDVSFSREINMDLPEYSVLKFANNSVLIQNIGLKGVIVFNTGSGYVAFEASDPNHYPSTCSQMQPNQFTCQCNCENNKYSLYDGQKIEGEGQYSMKSYHISQSGNRLIISN